MKHGQSFKTMAITINGNGTVTGISVGGLPDGIVDTDMLANNAVTASKASGSVKGITMHDVWNVSGEFSVPQGENAVTANWQRFNAINGVIGSAMTESSGVFTFPETGIYYIKINANFYDSGANAHNYSGFYIKYTTDNSNYSTKAFSGSAMDDYSGTTYQFTTCSLTFDVTNVSTHKVRFDTITSGGTMSISGTTAYNNLWAEFTRLGDT